MNHTPIEWTDFSSNPLKFRDEAGNVVWACVHASPGCQHCYSEQLAKRYGRGGPFNVLTTAKLTPFLDEKELHSMLTYKPASGKRCFPFDMTDLFGEWVPDDLLNRVFSEVLEQRRDVTWQLLTKRAARMRDYLSWRWKDRLVPRHIHIGVSVENQPMADKRIVELLQTPAAVRFISAEPLLGPVDVRPYVPSEGYNTIPCLDWVIVGGESGPGARPFDLAWAGSIVQQCKSAGVACFVKQVGAEPVAFDANHQWFDGKDFQQGGRARIHLKDRKGGDPAEWPEDLRVREFPEVRV